MISREAEWKKSLHQAQQQSRRRHDRSLADEQTQIQAAINQTKSALIAAAENRTYAEAERFFRSLIGLRAKQVALTLEEYKEQFGEVSPGTVHTLTTNYYSDCLVLAKTVDTLLGIPYRI